ncbi:GspH/FimT family pseudopilin [Undibacterium sp. Jales W-56]|uniref:GspH/FimT family pseudopilin n=1 Tax=Undibacterium sp. Jales W-56 TaxID=2897325 RepID=UPI0021D1B9A9|nr:GspH/FimT family pseudopilin [Undibacterium sp. Jales W-56]MCU6435654.1 GspH/FimT family pseudopilin [Undibacterium sp. Jales W-56]
MQNPNCFQLKKILKNQGFTLVELMVTITIAVILLAIAVPNMTSFINNNRVSTAVNEFVGATTLARSEAIKQGKLVTICRSTNAMSSTPTCDASALDWTSGWLVYVENSTSTNIGVYQATETILSRQAVFPNTILIPSSVTSITFNSSGQPITTATSTFNFSFNNLYGREVCMERTGRVKTIPGGSATNC